MDHIGILKHALETTLRHRALWILGLLWALVGGGSGGFSGNFGNIGNFGNRSSYRFHGHDFSSLAANFNPAVLLGFLALFCGLLLLLAVIAAIARYVLQAGIYRSLDQLHQAGTEPTVRGAWREGWHRRTWRLFFQNLIVSIPLVIGAILLDRKSTRLNSSHIPLSRMPSSA